MASLSSFLYSFSPRTLSADRERRANDDCNELESFFSSGNTGLRFLEPYLRRLVYACRPWRGCQSGVQRDMLSILYNQYKYCNGYGDVKHSYQFFLLVVFPDIPQLFSGASSGLDSWFRQNGKVMQQHLMTLSEFHVVSSFITTVMSDVVRMRVQDMVRAYVNGKRVCANHVRLLSDIMYYVVEGYCLAETVRSLSLIWGPKGDQVLWDMAAESQMRGCHPLVQLLCYQV